MTRAVHVLGGARFAQAESPRWDARTGGLAWIDMATGTLHHGRLEAGILRPAHAVHVGERIGAPAPLAEPGAGWLVGVGTDVVHVADDDTITPVASGLAPEPAFMNDGGCDPSGRFWIGTQSVPRAPRCALYSVEPDGRTVERLGGVTVSNGLAFDPAGTTLFYIDTLPDRSIEAFDVAGDGMLSNRRIVCRVAGGNPDGLAIDAEGMLWVAVWDAAEVRRYAPDGRVLEVVELPARRPTAVAFVGGLLVVTTARVGLSAPTALDGAMLGIEAGVEGRPASPWLGRPPAAPEREAATEREPPVIRPER